MRALFYVLIVDRFQQATFDRGNDAGQFVPALQYLAVFTEERPHALLIAQCRAFLDPRLRSFRCASESCKNGYVAREVHGIITPLPSSDHASVKIEYSGQFIATEAHLLRFTPGENDHRVAEIAHQSFKRAKTSF